MIGEWATMQEATRMFDVSRATIDRWRKVYLVREARLARNRPLMLNVKDLAKAERDANNKNPVPPR